MASVLPSTTPSPGAPSETRLRAGSSIRPSGVFRKGSAEGLRHPPPVVGVDLLEFAQQVPGDVVLGGGVGLHPVLDHVEAVDVVLPVLYEHVKDRAVSGGERDVDPPDVLRLLEGDNLGPVA